MNIYVVIDANFGDSGKGYWTEYFVNECRNNVCVIRFNGGAQAGHTVTTPAGNKHVFHHFGSGTFCGADTFLGKEFILNPFLWKKEAKELEKKYDKKIILKIHRDAIVTTPYDMLLNAELSKKGTTCGVGINETVQRHKKFPRTTIHASDLNNFQVVKGKLANIRDFYVSHRLQEAKVDYPSNWFKEKWESVALMYNWVNTAVQMNSSSTITDEAYLNTYKNLVFEGAQGLLLDQDHRFFPYVTHSKTGLTNVKETILNLKAHLQRIKSDKEMNVTVTYVTRPYMTRHGAGPFPTEDPKMSYLDLTNQPNEFQGTLRFGALDLDLMKEAILTDIKEYLNLGRLIHLDAVKRFVRTINDDEGFKFNIAVSCLNQVSDRNFPVKVNGKIVTVFSYELCALIGQHIGIPVRYQSIGHTRNEGYLCSSYTMEKVDKANFHRVLLDQMQSNVMSS